MRMIGNQESQQMGRNNRNRNNNKNKNRRKNKKNHLPLLLRLLLLLPLLLPLLQLNNNYRPRRAGKWQRNPEKVREESEPR